MKLDLFLLVIIVTIIIGILIYKNLGKIASKIRLTLWNLKKEAFLKGTIMPEEILKRKVALIIAFRDFKDEEYFIPKEILENTGAEIVTVSDQSEMAIGAGGGETEVDLTLADLDELRVAEYDAVVFIGGPGAIKHLDNEYSYSIAQAAVSQDIVLGAICISPTILAKAGVLQRKRATVWSSPLDRSAIKMLEHNGAIYEDKDVVVDGKIITGNGPAAAQEFGQKLVEALTVE